MTMIVSILGLIGRSIGKILTSSLGWASTLLYGRVPKDHQIFVEAMLGGSILWGFAALLLLIGPLMSFAMATTPFVPSLGLAVLRTVIVVLFIVLPPLVGLAGTFVAGDDQRPRGVALLGHALRGYPLSVLIVAVSLFLPLAAVARRIGSLRRGWSDAHIPIIVKPGGYEQMVDDLESALGRAGLEVTRRPAPRIMSVPGRLLAVIAGKDVGDLLPDQMIDLRRPDLEVGVYPSDVVISGPPAERIRARAALMTGLARTAAHLTRSAESQRVEDRLVQASDPGTARQTALADVAEIDDELARLDVPTGDWDVLLRLRLQAERDVLRRDSHPTRP